MQMFVEPDNAKEVFESWKERRMQWHQSILQKDNLRFREHGENERAHYAKDAWDIEYNFPFGFKEMEGIHNRGDWDLGRHSKYSGQKLEYFNEESKEHTLPWVVETSVGVDRLFLAALVDAYTEEEVNDDKRVVMKFDPRIAPVKVAILPLSKKPELSGIAHEIFRH